MKWREIPSARSLVMAFLSTSHGGSITSARLVLMGRVFGIEEAAMRMAIRRLVQDTTLIAVGRGRYAVAPRGELLNARVRGWRVREDGVRPWSGAWTVALVAHLPRIDRRRTAARERALRLMGFASTPAHWVRPANLATGIDEMTQTLHGLGLDGDAIVYGDCRATPDEDARLRTLWPIHRIAAEQRALLAALDRSLRDVARLSVADGARETLLLGQVTISAINRDPLLPSELADVSLRRRLAARMQEYDAIGRSLWTALDALPRDDDEDGAPR